MPTELIELMHVEEFLTTHRRFLTGLSYESFGSLMAMFFEEYALANGLTAPKLSREIADCVAMVNEQHGAYSLV